MSNPPLRAPLHLRRATRFQFRGRKKEKEGGNGGTRLEQPWASAKPLLALCSYSWACFILLTLSVSSFFLFSVKCFSSWPGLTEGCVCVWGVSALVVVVTRPTPAASCPLQPKMTDCKQRKRETREKTCPLHLSVSLHTYNKFLTTKLTLFFSQFNLIFWFST